MEEQETFAGIGSKVYLFRKDDLQEGVPFEQQADKVSVIDLSRKESKVSRQGFTQNGYNTFIRQQEDKSGNPIGCIIPNGDGTFEIIGDKEPKYKSRVYTTDNPNPKAENWCQSFSCSGEVELPFDVPIDGNRGVFCGDDEQRHIKADVEFETPEGKRYFVKDADIEINVCPALPHKSKPLLWDKLPCDMLLTLCYPLRWGDKHFNRRIAHYQWMKKHNYL